ncbi:sugar transferase [Dialister sp.]|uniref:sugar transferase n=1 Tax=Dialister sp. TaxID=1955814 RepID=UPI002E7FD3D8|nr:sugar transferase [Dialister sp.]MEE3453829.1 sugar transferase [Dialister sp.]
MNRFQRIVKRIADIVIALIMLLVLSPLMFIILLAVFAYDRKPPVFKQKRLTKDGQVFTLYKFRSMRPGAEESYKLTLYEDPRVTPVGRVIRRFRLDELPQLINVIKGDMSMVGPRPERPEIAREIEKTLPEFSKRLQVKAGLTGYAQVVGNYTTPSEQKLAYDLYYIEHFSLGLDLKIMLMTARVMFMSEKSEGLRPEKTDDAAEES